MNEAPLLEEPQESLEASATNPVCEKCARPVASQELSACPHCGWYARAGVFVEIDQQWEAATAGPGKQEVPKTHLQVWMTLIPGWCWLAWGCGVLAVIGSIAARVLIADEAFRSTWSVTQLFAGMGIGLLCHVTTFIFVSFDDPDLSISDIVVSPLKPWKKLFQQMPTRQWVVCLNTFGMTAAVGAMFIIGGIPYERVWDWGITPPAKKSLLNAIAEAAPDSSSDMSMEEAMSQFAEDAAVDGAGGPKGNGKPAAGAKVARKKADVLILGYHLDRNNLISEFLVASEVNGTLFYGGRVIPVFTPDESMHLVERLRLAHAPRPTVSAPDGATWLQPRFTCRISYDKRVESGRLQGIAWEEMLGEIKLPW
ncbi:MAG: hypothetical protein AAGF31_12725 [Planctomycetota bacterium]